jgi:hypothetical protein
VTTGESGQFEVNLPVGEYAFGVQAKGFCTFEGELLRVKANTTEAINIHLEAQGFDNWKLTDKFCRCTSKPTLNKRSRSKNPEGVKTLSEHL